MISENQHIFLIGFMGSGKTYWGKKWAEIAGINFIDLDDTIEKEQAKTITGIFATEGEDHFRKLETVALKKISPKQNAIIATGGGTPCFNDNISWMNKNGISVYLQSSPENILKRLITEKDKRPLVKSISDDDLLIYITNKIKEREIYYKQATIILNVDGLPQQYVPQFLNI